MATPEQWGTNAARWPEAILELRARVEQLEAAAHKHIVETSANILALASRVESLEAAERKASKVHQISKPLKLTPEQAQGIKDLLAPEPRRNYPVKPYSSLVERVGVAIFEQFENNGGNEAEARAAIREVALWLNEAPLDLCPGDRGIVVNALYDQANP